MSGIETTVAARSNLLRSSTLPVMSISIIGPTKETTPRRISAIVFGAVGLIASMRWPQGSQMRRRACVARKRFRHGPHARYAEARHRLPITLVAARAVEGQGGEAGACPHAAETPR